VLQPISGPRPIHEINAGTIWSVCDCEASLVRATAEDRCDHRARSVGASAIGYSALHATIASGRVRLATAGGALAAIRRAPSLVSSLAAAGPAYMLCAGANSHPALPYAAFSYRRRLAIIRVQHGGDSGQRHCEMVQRD
jgi:hypothetical protein